jgi:DNA-binding response OmpR family regulator
MLSDVGSTILQGSCRPQRTIGVFGLANILLVEDEAVLRETISYNLTRAGHEVKAVGDGEAGLKAVGQQTPDLVVLDVMLPTIDGFEVCRQIRRSSSIPILILTARDDEIDRVVGLEIGADDYLTKPFSMRELVARVKALLRRRDLLQDELTAGDLPVADVIQAGDLTIDMGAHRVTVAGTEVNLKPREWDLLVFLARHPGQVCTSDQILHNVWGEDFFGDSRTVAVHVHGLREKLEIGSDGRRHIETVRGVGYRFAV